MHKLGIGLAVLFMFLGVVYVTTPGILWHIGSILVGLGAVVLVLSVLVVFVYAISWVDKKYGGWGVAILFGTPIATPLTLWGLHSLGQAILRNCL